MRSRALLIALAIGGLLAGAAHGADYTYGLPANSPYNPASFDFSGFYLGAQAGPVFGMGGKTSLGVVAGVNFDVSDPILAGLEFQGDMLVGNGTPVYDFYALGRVGARVSSNLIAYGEAGPGWMGGVGGYAFGGGAEYALTDTMSVKGDVQGLGSWGNGPDAARVQAGLLFHLQ